MPKKKPSSIPKKQTKKEIEMLDAVEELLPSEKKEIEREMGKFKNIDIDNIEDIEEEIQKNLQSENESKELFSKKDIRTKTDLSDNEIVYATKLRFMRVKYNLPIYDLLLDEFMEMRLSKNRKSRKEYIESMKQKVKDFFGGTFGGQQNGRL